MSGTLSTGEFGMIDDLLSVELDGDFNMILCCQDQLGKSAMSQNDHFIFNTLLVARVRDGGIMLPTNMAYGNQKKMLRALFFQSKRTKLTCHHTFFPVTTEIF